jgi:hypothetical protein
VEPPEKIWKRSSSFQRQYNINQIIQDPTRRDLLACDSAASTPHICEFRCAHIPLHRALCPTQIILESQMAENLGQKPGTTIWTRHRQRYS